MKIKFEENKILRSFDGSSFKQPLTYKPFRTNEINHLKKKAIIPRGSCTSYVLACCDDNSISVDMSQFNLIISFNKKNGELKVQSGIQIRTIVNFLESKGFIFPIVPGNPYATIGGAVAANVHGKNSYLKGVIYDHITSINLLLRNSEYIECFPKEPLFEATIGGFGITGIILEVTIKCIKSKNNAVKISNYKVNSIKEAGLVLPTLKKHDYLYSFHKSSNLIQNTTGFIIAADYIYQKKSKKEFPFSKFLDKENSHLTNPFLKINKRIPCIWNKFTISLAQSLFIIKSNVNLKKTLILDEFYFPLDQFKTYYSLFGRRGFLETQVLVPLHKWESYCDNFIKIAYLNKLSATVLSLKLFEGEDRLISFSGTGISLTADFPYSVKALRALDSMDKLNCEFGVKSNIIKDRRLSSDIVSKQYDTESFKELLNICQESIYGPDKFLPNQSELLRRIIK